MQSFILDSSHFDILRVSGSDAERFLQGQLTCDVSAVPSNGYVFGAACNNKGRVITPFMLYRQNQDFVLIFRNGLSSVFAAALKKFLPFFKCSMMRDTNIACLGLGGDALPELLASAEIPTPTSGQAETLPHGWIARITGDLPQYLICADVVTVDEIATIWKAALIPDEGTFWQAACMLNGHFPFAPSDTEIYTPQELHYEQKQYVSFSKGCYTGQEIVARMHYRGKIKKQLYRVELPCGDGLELAPLALLAQDGTKLAECQKTTRLPAGTCLALVVLPVDIATTDQKFLTSSGSSVHLQSF